MIDIERNTYVVIRVNGTRETHTAPFRLDDIGRQIGAACLDAIILTKRRNQADLVMVVDDTGMIYGKPVNPEATRLYHEVRKPGTTYKIRGDVAILHDSEVR